MSRTAVHISQAAQSFSLVSLGVSTRHGGLQFVRGAELLSAGRPSLGDQTETLLAALEKL